MPHQRCWVIKVLKFSLKKRFSTDSMIAKDFNVPPFSWKDQDGNWMLCCHLSHFKHANIWQFCCGVHKHISMPLDCNCPFSCIWTCEIHNNKNRWQSCHPFDEQLQFFCVMPDDRKWNIFWELNQLRDLLFHQMHSTIWLGDMLLVSFSHSKHHTCFVCTAAFGFNGCCFCNWCMWWQMWHELCPFELQQPCHLAASSCHFHHVLIQWHSKKKQSNLHGLGCRQQNLTDQLCQLAS